MEPLLFLSVGFAITNALAFLHVGRGFRRVVSGISDDDFLLRLEYMSPGPLMGFRQSFLGKLVRCHACLGFWIGAILSLLLWGVTTEYLEAPSKPVCAIADGFLLSGFNFVLWVCLKKLGVEEL